jgi:nucleoside-diphosphate-sugar epimerase
MAVPGICGLAVDSGASRRLRNQSSSPQLPGESLGASLAQSPAGVRRFVYVSSSEVHATARSEPMTEEDPTYAKTVYGAGKLAGDGYTRPFQHTYGFATVVARPFNTYGPRCHHEGDSGGRSPSSCRGPWPGGR